MKYNIKVGTRAGVSLLCVCAAVVCLAVGTYVSGLDMLKTRLLRPVGETPNHSNVQIYRYHGQPLKKFVYLTQTESCLPKYLQAPQQLGNSSSCQCDVLVLSYRQKCNDSSLQLPHVEYIFDPDTSWTTGRNLLYRIAKKRGQKYLYYTLMDDDITLIFKEKSQESLNPWREYEKAVLQMRPIIAVSWEGDSEKLFAKYYKGECHYPKKPVFLAYTWFDALFNSFHHKIVDSLLPYYDKLDNTSIWYSQVYLIMKTDIMFPDQVFHHVNILAHNPLHRPYPRRMDYSDVIQNIFLDRLENEIPVEYRDLLQPRLQDWLENVTQKKPSAKICPLYPTNLGTIESEPNVVPYAYLHD